MGARHSPPLAPSVKSFERSFRVGPKGQPFFVAAMSDGSTRTLRGLNPIETKAFVEQHIAEGVTQKQADIMVAAINSGESTA